MSKTDPQSAQVYRPTSLAFINGPNPVEPQSVPQRHPLDGTSSQDMRHILHERTALPSDEGPIKRQKPIHPESVIATGDKSLDLPKLPVRENTKRLRIPPTLSGLHQPPPNAGLLPSILTEQPTKPHPQTRSTPRARRSKSPDNSAPSATKPPLRTKAKRNKWTTEETDQLLKGVARFGIGSWTRILHCPDYSFPKRTAIDLKDRFRVCCPDNVNDKRTANRAASGTSRSHKKTATQLQELGINTPFAQTSRRKRKGYTAAEDVALLKGFERHGNAWAVIRGDEELGLEGRRSMDLRDRFRTKYPKLYAEAGLAPRPERFPKQQHVESVQVADDENAQVTEGHDGGGKGKTPARPTHAHHSIALFPTYDDVFFGAPGDEMESGVGERITLDRGILDWPSGHRFDRLPAPSEMVKGGGIDPLATLMKLPRPQPLPGSNNLGKAEHAPRPQLQPALQSHSAPLPSVSGPAAAALPSLASVTAGVGFQEGMSQLELPSLVGCDTLEHDSRAGGHFLGLDELLC